MKNHILKFMATSILMMCFTVATNAQEGFYFGVKGMPQVTFLLNQDNSDDDDHEYERTFRSAFGIGGGYKFSETAGVALDVIYSMEGQKSELFEDRVIEGIGPERYDKVTYLKIPLMFTFNTDPSGSVYFTGRIGPQVNLLMNASLENWDGDEINDDTSDGYSSTVLAGTLSLLATINATEQLKVDIGFRGDYGFTDAADNDDDDAAATMPTTGALEVGVRYALSE